MEGRFEFEGAEVRALIAESRGADRRLYTEAQRYLAAGVDLSNDEPDVEVDLPEEGAPPGLWLMNDAGVYLRSNAADRPAGSLAYARGYRAEVQVGDEAACEWIDAAPLDQLREGDTLVVTVGERKLALSLIRPG